VKDDEDLSFLFGDFIFSEFMFRLIDKRKVEDNFLMNYFCNFFYEVMSFWMTSLDIIEILFYLKDILVILMCN
jgi:hypothetical protein